MDSSNLPALKEQLSKLINNLEQMLKVVPTGRAHPSLLDGLIIDLGDYQVPLNQVAAVLSLDATSLKITPFDNKNIKFINEAIQNDAKLNLSPTDDGRSVYLAIPLMTLERRQEVVKQLQAHQEEHLIQLRQHRHHCLKKCREDIEAEDQLKGVEKKIETLVTDCKNQLTKMIEDKSQEILKLEV